MLFTVTRAEVEWAAGVDGTVHRMPAGVAERYGFRGQAADFLATVGVPGVEEYGLEFRVPDAYDPELVGGYEELAAAGWEVGPEVDDWVPLGHFSVNTVWADPRSGKVYQFTEGPLRPLLLHADLSSFVRTIVVAVETARACEPVVGRPDEEEQLTALVEAGMARVRDVDPLPFADEHSEWHEVFGCMENAVYW
ncbi:SUKH-4 family immunity protein [Streptomyces sp. NPDC005012]|uniref:SUKH-4 family immunity protein n=1 Tax=Streptomyces sp. NPDC005012 TaxID=3154558 RepID=UPI0033B10289